MYFLLKNSNMVDDKHSEQSSSYLLKLDLCNIRRKIDPMLILILFNTFMLGRSFTIYCLPWIELVIVIDFKHNRQKYYDYPNNLKDIDAVVEIKDIYNNCETFSRGNDETRNMLFETFDHLIDY